MNFPWHTEVKSPLQLSVETRPLCLYFLNLLCLGRFWVSAVCRPRPITIKTQLPDRKHVTPPEVCASNKPQPTNPTHYSLKKN